MFSVDWWLHRFVRLCVPNNSLVHFTSSGVSFNWIMSRRTFAVDPGSQGTGG
jgi:hypothetical protein